MPKYLVTFTFTEIVDAPDIDEAFEIARDIDINNILETQMATVEPLREGGDNE